MSEYTITVTSKGQFTMPARVRRELGIGEHGGRLTLRFNESSKKIEIRKPVSFEDIQVMAAGFVAEGIEPLEDARAFYEKRKPSL